MIIFYGKYTRFYGISVILGGSMVEMIVIHNEDI